MGNMVRSKKFFYTMFNYAVLLLIGFIIILPILSMIGTSFKSPEEIFNTTKLFPSKLSWFYYNKVVATGRFLHYVKNSFVIAIIVAGISTLFSILAGYSLARYKNTVKGLKAYVYILLMLQMFPVVLIIVPLYTSFQAWGIRANIMPVLIIYTTFTLPLNIWMMNGFFEGIPRELEEAGKIDGCNRIQCLFRIILPISGPSIASVAIFAFNYCWNEYMLGSIFLKNDALKTIPIGLQSFILENSTDWGSLMAASTIAIIPVIIFLTFLQKYLVQGLTDGAVKG